jgi:alkylhydroperoxidase family enzyme
MDATAKDAAGAAARLAPLEPPYAPELGQMLARWMPPGSELEPLRLFRTLALHEELLVRMRPLGAGILGRRALVEPILREVMIHRTCALTGAEYEWGVHAVAFGRPLGLDSGQLTSTVHGSHADACWSAEQALVMRLAEELHRTSAISDELWGALRERFSEAQVLELIVTAGWYHVIAYLCNGARVQGEEWAERFPAAPA